MSDLQNRDKEFIWHPYTHLKFAGAAIPIIRGKGALLFDEQGDAYIDAVSSWWTNLHGHAHPYIAQKLAEQLTKLEHVIFAGFTHQPAVDLAERLLKVLPANQSRIFYSDNGSTAVESALKMAFQFWHNQGKRKTKILALRDAYHGDTFGSMSVSMRGIFNQPFEPFLFEVIYLDKSTAITKQVKNPGEIAAMIFEPLVQGAGGMLMYGTDWLNDALQYCKEHQILTIADEVMTGFGRTGKMFASEYLEITPDIFCLSKGITGGFLPLGATTCTQEIFETFVSDDRMKTFFHGHSYTANPLACTAALASLDLLQESECWARIKTIEKAHRDFLSEIKNNPSAENPRMKGTILAFEVKTGEEKTGYLNEARDRLYRFFIDNKVLLRPLGNTVYIMPPYCIESSELEKIYEVIRKGLKQTAY